MSRYTKELRQQIVREFALRHNGQYNPALFVDEVLATGPDHPAHDWFEWDQAKAASEHRLWQAREFASGLKVTFAVEEVGADRSVAVRTAEMPLVLSPTAGRSDGGGYWLSDPGSPEHMAEFCEQAATGLATWLRRYASAVQFVGEDTASIDNLIARLRSAAGKRAG